MTARRQLMIDPLTTQSDGRDERADVVDELIDRWPSVRAFLFIGSLCTIAGGPVGPPTTATAPARPRRVWRSVAVPSEHGGWGLMFEPVLLGLIVVRSRAGVAIGAAAMLAFVARTSAKVVLVDSRRHRSLPRTRAAALIAAAEIAVLVVLLGVAAATASGPFWIPLLAAGAWLVIVARAVASLPFVRYQLRRVKRQPYRRWAQDLAQGGAVALATGFALTAT